MTTGTITLDMHDVKEAIEDCAQGAFSNYDNSVSLTHRARIEVSYRFDSYVMMLAAISYFDSEEDCFNGCVDGYDGSPCDLIEQAVWERARELYEEAGMEVPED